MSSEPERLLKSSEFCRIVGISYRTFKRWVSEGRIRVPYSEVVKIIGGKTSGGEVRAVIYTRVTLLIRRAT